MSGRYIDRLRILRPLSVRDFRLLWIGQTVSLLGNGFFTVALAWQTVRLSDSATALSAVLFARWLPQVLLFAVGGAVTDRASRRRVMLVSDLVQGVAAAIVAVMAAAGDLQIWHLVALAAVYGGATAFYLPAATAIVPDIVTKELLVAANSLHSVSRYLIGQLLGPAVAGVIIAAQGTTWAFGADAASFVVSVTTLLLIRTLPRAPSGEGDLVARIKEGIRYTRAHRWLWVALVVAAIGNLFAYGPLMALLPLVADQRLDVSAAGYGFLLACFGLGAAAAMLVSGQIGAPKRRVTAIYAGWFVADLCLAAIGLTPSLVVAMILYGVLGFCLEYGNVLWVAMLQDLVPAEVLGRVSSLDWMLSVSMIPIAVAIAGPAAEAVGLSTVIVTGGLAAAAITIIGWLRPGVRDPELDTDAREQASTV
jgi:MFS family permease